MADPKVKFKRSSVSGKRPTVDNVELGEIALNTYDGRLYTLQDTGGIGIGTTTTLLTPWQESYGGSGISYTGDLNVTGVTTITGSFNVTSFSTFNGNIKLFDGKYLNLGNSNDLQIVHDGNNAVIQNSTGQIFFDNNSEGGDIFLRANDNVVIRVDGNDTVFTAQTGGIDVTGHVETDTLQVSGITTTASLEVTGNTETGTLNVSGIVTASSLDISGNVDVDGTLEADAITIDGVSLAETISDTVGAMVSSNTETNISVTYDDSDNTLDFVIGTLNQDTTGNAATATALETARTIGGVSFDGTGNINLPGVNATGNQDTSGNAATATALETARTIGGVSFDGTGNINLPGVNQAGNQNTSGTAAGLSGAPSITVTDITAVGNVSIAGTLTYEDVTSIDAIGIVTARTGVRVTTGGLIVSAGGANITGGITGDLTGDVTGDVTGNTSGSSGSCTGNSATATEATNFTVTANNSTNETVYPVFVDGATGTQGAETDTGLTYNPSTGNLTSTKFTGSGSSLTGLTGASAATYGSSEVTPVIAVDSNGRITGISTVATSGLGLVTKDVTKVTATGGQTVFNGTYSVGFVDVFLNGSKLDSTEFTATNGTSITLTTGATANDIIEIVGFTVSGSSGTSITQGDTSAQVVDSGSDGHFKVSTDGTERLRVTSAGKLGIGTDNPSSNLTIAEDDSSTNAELAINYTGSGNRTSAIKFQRGGTNYGYIAGAGFMLTTGAQDDLAIAPVSGKNLLFGIGNSEKLRITSGGNIGIGVTNPSEKLHVDGGVNDRIAISGSGSSGLLFKNSSGTNLFQIIYDDASTDSTFITTSDDLVFRNQGGTQGGSVTERMRLDSSGRVGLGTDSPSSLLHLSGSGNQYATVTSTNSANAGILFGDSSDNAAGKILYVNSVDSLLFGTGGVTERMRINGSGYVAIGGNIITDSNLLNIQGSGATKNIGITLNDTNASQIYGISNGSSSLKFYDYTASAERMRIDSSGRLLVGATSSIDVASSASAKLQVTHAANSLSAAFYSTVDAIGPAGVIALGHGRGSVTGLLSDDDVMGQIRFAGADGTDLETVGAQISAEVDGTPGANDMPGRLVFSTTADGSSSATERMRIDSSGRLLIGTNSSTGSHKLEVNGGTDNEPIKVVSSDEGAYITFADDDTTGSTRLGAVDNDFKIDVASAERMRISSAGMLQIDTNDIKVRNITVGRGPGNIDTDTVVGQDALLNRTTGVQSVAVGRNALKASTTGGYNVAVGYNALDSATTGYSNTIVGAYSMATATTASLCCSFGTDSLNANTAWYNNAFGKDALRYNTTGYANAAFGYRTLRANTTASANTAFGTEALDNNTTAWSNAAFGAYALKANTTGASNVAVGRNALYSNTTASSNTSVGRSSMYSNTTGVQNSSVGKDSLYDNTTGQNNQALGFRSLRKNTTGSENVAIGRDSGYFNTTGSGNISIGVVNSSGSYAPVFGLSTSNNRVVMGSTAVTNAYVQVAWTVVSDARDKMNFGTVPHGLEFIKQLNPVSFQFKFARDSDTPNGPVRYGFKAQDILALEGEDNSVIIDNDDPDKLRYNGEALVPVLVNAIKEQQTIIDTLIARLDAAGI